MLCTVLAWDVQLLPLMGGSLVGLYITPDLDVDNGFLTDQLIRKYLGWPAEWIWKMFWHPYRRSLKHGGPLSHFPPIGTMGRILYVYMMLIVIPCLLLYLLYTWRGYGWNFQGELMWWWTWVMSHWKVIAGLAATDLIHWALDILTTEHTSKHSPRK